MFPGRWIWSKFLLIRVFPFFLLHRFYGWLHEYQRAIFPFYLSYYVVLIDIDWMMHTYITVIKPERIMDLTSPLL